MFPIENDVTHSVQSSLSLLQANNRQLVDASLMWQLGCIQERNCNVALNLQTRPMIHFAQTLNHKMPDGAINCGGEMRDARWRRG